VHKTFSSKGQGAIEYLLIIGAVILVTAVVIIALSGVLTETKQTIDKNEISAVNDPLNDLLGCSNGQEKCEGAIFSICNNKVWKSQGIVIRKCNVECTSIDTNFCGSQLIYYAGCEDCGEYCKEPLDYCQNACTDNSCENYTYCTSELFDDCPGCSDCDLEYDPTTDPKNFIFITNPMNTFLCNANYKLEDKGLVEGRCGISCSPGATKNISCGCNGAGIQTQTCNLSGLWDAPTECINSGQICIPGESSCEPDLITLKTCAEDGCSYDYPTAPGSICRTGALNKIFASGFGTILEPYGISTCQELQNISYDANTLDKNYILTSNINCSPIANFIPINGFNGKINGNNKPITGLKISMGSGTTKGGLFGSATNAFFEDMNLVNYNITAGNNSGGLVGSCSNCTLSNISVSGELKNILGQTAIEHGGIVGSLSNSSLINSSAIVKISFSNDAGGLVGKSTTSTIMNSYADVNLFWNSNRVGGLVGTLTGTTPLIKNSYAKGTITEYANPGGGLVGYQGSGTIENCYSDVNISSISANVLIGGLVGSSYPATTWGAVILKNSFSVGKLSGGTGSTIGGAIGRTANTTSGSGVYTTYLNCVGSGTTLPCDINQTRDSFLAHTGTNHAVYYLTPEWDTNWTWRGYSLPTFSFRPAPIISLGPEKINNGTFTNDFTNWTNPSNKWIITPSKKAINPSSEDYGLTQSLAQMISPPVVGEFYQLTYTISSYSQPGTLDISGKEFNITQDGIFTHYFTQINTAYSGFLINSPEPNGFEIDDISLKKVTTN
jgi:uncharacterized protein (UPF0333 family)